MPPPVSQSEGQNAGGDGRYLLLDHNGYGELKSEQARRVIDETFSFENVHDAGR